jgi:hypothetical protein
MVPTGIVEVTLIPWPLVPATLIRPPLIRSPLVPKLATVATVSTMILSTVTALVALAVLWPARLPTIPVVGGRRPETDAQPESAKAQRAHDRGSRHSLLETHCCAPFSVVSLPPNRVDRSESQHRPRPPYAFA